MRGWVPSVIAIASASNVVDDSEFIGWRMIDRFAGFRYEITGKVHDVGFQQAAQHKADELSCFGWIQDTSRGTLVGEVRCAKVVAPIFKEWLRNGPERARVTNFEVYDYPDTKIKLHFSHFKILTPDRDTCFHAPPHQCPEATSPLHTHQSRTASTSTPLSLHSEL